MPRLSIDITTEEHKKLKAIAALKGQSIKEYVLEKSLHGIPVSENKSVKELEAFLNKRLKEIQCLSQKTPENIFKEAFKEPL